MDGWDLIKIATPFITFALGYYTKEWSDEKKRLAALVEDVQRTAVEYLCWLEEAVIPVQASGLPASDQALRQSARYIAILRNKAEPLKDETRYKHVYDAVCAFARLVEYGPGTPRSFNEPLDWRLGAATTQSTVGVLRPFEELRKPLFGLIGEMGRHYGTR